MIQPKTWRDTIRTVAWRRPVSKIGRGGPVLALLAWLLVLAAPGAAQQAPPDEDWRTISTERARITFPARLEALGRRAAHRTEVALSALDSSFLSPPEGTIDIVVTDHTDISNGFAQVTPSNRVTIYARPPVDEPGLGYFDDWLELVLTHELAHVVHLDRTGTPLGKLLRAVFGRVPTRWPFFPGHGTPRWVKEGLATWYESALTDAGRIQGTFHEMQIRTAVLGGRFEGIGQASASSPVWPAGNRPYLYGSLFFEHMLERHGEDRMAAFAEAVAGQWIPYRLDAAGEDAFGVSFSNAWNEWADSLEAHYAHLDDTLADFGSVTEPEWVTSGARWAVEPAVGPGGALAYVRSDGRSDTRIVLEPVEGEGRDASLRVNGIASFDWMPDGRLLVGQLEREDPYRLFSDLYVVDPRGGTRRVTHGARLAQPTSGPDGTWAVAVLEGGGTSELVRVSLSDGSVTPLSDPDEAVHWAHPATSPDGSFVAATRRRRGGTHDVVVLDAETGAVLRELTNDRALDLAPSWSPDGRWVVWASDRTGILNLLAASFDPDTGASGPPRLLTNVRTGASFPSVDPSGRTLHYSAYHAEGWDVASVPFEPEAAPEAPPPHARFERDRPFEDGAAAGAVEPYSPIPTLLPKYWEPLLRRPVRTPATWTSDGPIRQRELLGFAVGARTGGRDLVGRHAYDAFGRVFTSGGKVEGGLAYAYWGLGNPVLSLSASQHWDDDGVRLGRMDPEAAPDTLFVLERERSVSASGRFRIPSWRDRFELTLSVGWVEEARTLLDNDLRSTTSYRLARPGVDLGELRGSVSFSTARSHAFQVGSSKGIDLFLSGRSRQELNAPDSVRGVVGRDRSVVDLVGRARGYLPLGGPGHASHVLAVELTGGVAGGPNAPGGHFEAGGASGRPETLTGLRLFGGSPRLFGVRGYASASRLGRHAWAASGEYRLPLRLVHQGLGAWPLYLGRVVGALFADAGDAWDPGTTEEFLSPARRPLASVGAEVGAEIVALYEFPLLTRVGVAQPLVGGRDPSVYVRLGLSF